MEQTGIREAGTGIAKDLSIKGGFLIGIASPLRPSSQAPGSGSLLKTLRTPFESLLPLKSFL
jgi:hypothetical protein